MQSACAISTSVASNSVMFFFIISWTAWFSEKSTELKMCFWVFLQLLLVKIFLILKRIQRNVFINVKRFHVKYPLFVSDFNENLTFSTDFRKKSLIIKFNQNPSSGSRIITCGQTDGHDEAYSRFSQLRKRASRQTKTHRKERMRNPI